MPRKTVRTDEKDEVFFTALANGHPVTAACEAASYPRTCVYAWREDDADFAKRWRQTKKIGAELLEDEADRRGRDGYDEPVFFRGERRDSRKKYSDGLLLARLKAEFPEKYQERPASTAITQQQMTVVVHDVTSEAALLRLIEEKRAPTIDDLPTRLKQRLLKNEA